MKSKADIIYQLMTEVSKTVVKASYGRKRGKLIQKGISEIALLSAVAEHIEENDIPPKLMASDVITLIDGCGENAFFIKTDDRFDYLRHGFNDLLLSKSDAPEKTGKFLCNTCFRIKNDSHRSTKKNYAHSCNDCYLEYSRTNAANQLKKNDLPESMKAIDGLQKRKYKKREPKADAVEGVVEEATCNPFITLKNVIADSAASTIELTVNTTDLLKVLTLIDDFLLREDGKEDAA